MKRKIFTLLLGVVVGTFAFGQDKPVGLIMKASVAPVIDGVVDDVWADANVYSIDKNFQAELPTLGDAGQTTWQALWDSEGIYILLKVTDDAFYPNYAVTPAGNNWEYDKPELYFDCNYVLADGVGGHDPSNLGHYQFAPGFTDGKNDGTQLTSNNATYAFMVTEPDYIAEYFIPFTKLLDQDGIALDKQGNIGFDVTIIDRDPADAARKRAVWANVGLINESYNNMDDCGIVTLDGATAGTDVESITITGGAITENNGTLQMTAEVLPVDATTKTVRWTLENGTGRATISSDGVITAIADGDVTVVAAAMDASYVESDPVTVTISGQITSYGELNVIKNGTFVTDGGLPSPWGWWSGNGGLEPTVEDGHAVCHPVLDAVNAWQYQFNQSNLTALPNIDYEFTFKAWADVDRIINVDFESAGTDLYARYGHSSDATSNGTCDWTFGITTEPTLYTLHVNFDAMVAGTIQKVQYMVAETSDPVYLDDIALVNVTDLALITPDVVNVTEITVTGAGSASTITANSGTLQMSAAVLPVDATVTDVKWSVVDGTATATIDAAGVLTATGTAAGNGTVTVKASAKDDSQVYGTLEVTISGQAVGVAQNSIKAFSVYPNPVANELNVYLNSANQTVAIYNSVGKKMEEVFVNGTQHKFDVSSYAKGLYFVKVNNTVEKFIK